MKVGELKDLFSSKTRIQMVIEGPDGNELASGLLYEIPCAYDDFVVRELDLTPIRSIGGWDEAIVVGV